MMNSVGLFRVVYIAGIFGAREVNETNYIVFINLGTWFTLYTHFNSKTNRVAVGLPYVLHDRLFYDTSTV